MADFSPPNHFSNVAHKWVHDKKRDSVFFVKVVRRPHCHNQIIQHLRNNLNMTQAQAEETIARPFYATGFLIHRDGDLGYLLTCSHLLQEIYTAESVLTLERARWFRFMVICKHNEHNMEINFPNLCDPNNDPRNYTPALPVRVDQSRDLMVLEIDMTNLYGSVYPHQCQLPHPVLQLARHLPQPLDDVVMISWPPHRCDTVVIGQVVNYRSYIQMTADRTRGYNMDLMELKINGFEGTSGSPILNSHGDVTSLYHGRIDAKGYAVTLEEIGDFLSDGEGDEEDDG